MTLKRFFLQVVLNLPERKPRQVEPPAAPTARPAAPAETNPWLSAAPVTATGATSDAGTDAGTTEPWSPATGQRTARAWRYGLRTAGLVVLALFAWIGVRTTLFPAPAPEAEPLPVEITFDHASAHAVATRFVTSAMSWDEDDTATRTDAIALDYTGLDMTLGWNGKGRQEVTRAIAGPVLIDTEDDARALVTVFAQITFYDRAERDGPWQAGAARWITVEVPVAEVGGRLVASAAPALTGYAPASQAPTRTQGAGDQSLTSETQESARAFFEAYGRGDVSALEAPGAQIPAPAAGWDLVDLTSWSVTAGTGPTRAARAQVVWALDGPDQTLTHTYDLTLTRVSVGTAERWQVSAIHASR